MKIASVEVIKPFKSRFDRTEWLYNRFVSSFAEKKILDVGCDYAPLRSMAGIGGYVGVDIGGDPDVVLNLEDLNRLPFDNHSFDTVICIEVLEHLENIHALSSELFRVSSGDVIMSLPNCWRDARLKIERGVGNIAHYGLPTKKPLHRHKWFFNVEEACSFYESIKPSNYDLKIIVTDQARPLLIKFWRHIRYSSKAYLNRYGNTAWAIFTRND